MTTNEDRANWARLALDAFRGPGGPFSSPDVEEPITCISDLITDLLHLARRECGMTDAAHFAKLAAEMHDIEVEEDEEA